MSDITQPITVERAIELKNEIIGIISSCMIDYMQAGSVTDESAVALKKELNILIGSDGLQCTQLFFTTNIDKQNFGIYILPEISDYDIRQIVNNCRDDIKFREFRMEIDASMLTSICDGNFTPVEVFAMMLSDIYAMMTNSPFNIQVAIQACICNTGRAAAGYIIKLAEKQYQYRLLRYVMVSFLRNLYTFAGDDMILRSYQTNHILGNNSLGIGPMCEKIYNDRIVSPRGSSNPGAEISMFRWVFDIFDDIDMHLVDAIDTLSTIKSTTGSVLEGNLVSVAIESLKDGAYINHTDKYIKEAFMTEGFSLFKSLKTNGLRGIEDDLYEYKIRLKNCEDEEDAMYILRQINTRLTILSDYLDNTDGLSERERERWQACINSYRDLRYQLGQKKLGAKKQYGVFIDYDKLDQMY